MSTKIYIGNCYFQLETVRVTKPLTLGWDEPNLGWNVREDYNSLPETILPDDYELEHIFAGEKDAGFNYIGKTHKHSPEFFIRDIVRLHKEGAIELAKFGESLPEIDAKEYIPWHAAENIIEMIQRTIRQYDLEEVVWVSETTDSGESDTPDILESLYIPSRTCVGYSSLYNFEIEIKDNREIWLNIRVEVKLVFVVEDYKFISESPIKIILTDFDRPGYLDDMEAELQDESPLAVVYQEKVCVVPKP